MAADDQEPHDSAVYALGIHRSYASTPRRRSMGCPAVHRRSTPSRRDAAPEPIDKSYVRQRNQIFDIWVIRAYPDGAGRYCPDITSPDARSGATGGSPMVQDQLTHSTLARPQALRRSARATRWQRLLERWARAWNMSPVEGAINAEVCRYLRHKPVEPDDVVVVNWIIEDISRHSEM